VRDRTRFPRVLYKTERIGRPEREGHKRRRGIQNTTRGEKAKSKQNGNRGMGATNRLGKRPSKEKHGGA